MTLDPRTIMFVTACMGPVLAMVLLSLRSAYPSSIRGLGWWAQGTWWIFFGVVLVTMRDWIPASLSIVAGNALLIIGTWHWLVGTNKFLGLKSYRNVWLVAVGVAIAATAWFYAVQPNFLMRSVAVCGVMVAMLLVHATNLLRQKRYTYASRFLSYALMASVADWLLRLFGALSGWISPGLFEPSHFNALVNGIQTVSGLLILVGFVLLASDGVRHDFEMLASRDSLTGALMRRAWNAAASAEVERGRRHQRALSLIAMDLDHFKQINDAHGHAVGDQVLVQFVAMVGQHLRGADQLGRIGGEEFVLLPETSLEDAMRVAERIRLAAQALEKPCPVTVSMGVAHLLPTDDGIASLLERADAALYRAKARGRNQVERETAAPANGNGGNGSVHATHAAAQHAPIKSSLRRA